MLKHMEPMSKSSTNLPSASDEYEGLSRQHREQLDQLKNTNAVLHEIAWDIEEIEQRLYALLAQREGPIDILAEREINELQRQQADLEDQMLHEMLRADELAAQVAHVQQEIRQRSPSERN